MTQLDKLRRMILEAQIAINDAKDQASKMGLEEIAANLIDGMIEIDIAAHVADDIPDGDWQEIGGENSE